MKKFIARKSLLLSIIWASVIFILCATPGQYIPSASWLDMLSFDKFVHASLFFVLSSLAFISVEQSDEKAYVFVVIFFVCILYGGVLEIMQAKVLINRNADWQDFVANSFGCLLAAVLFKKIKSFFS